MVFVGWCALAIGLRWFVDRRLPGTLLLGSAALAVKAAVALATASTLIYLLQPVAGSVAMAVLFLGSAAVGRPMTVRLAGTSCTCPPKCSTTAGYGGCSPRSP